MQTPSSSLSAALPLIDSPDRYGRISRLLHWAMAAILAWQFLGMIVRAILGRHPVSAFFVGSHQMIGTLLLLLALARLAWAFTNRARRPAHPLGRAGLAARLGHGALYALLVVLPLIGVIRAIGGKRAFAPFGFEIAPAREEAIAWTEQLGVLHSPLAWLLLVLIVGHIAMALWHTIVAKDGTMRRMAGRG